MPVHEHYSTNRQERAVLVSVNLGSSDADFAMRQAELRELAYTAGAMVAAEI